MQSILNFSLEITNEKLTPRTGVVIFGEYLKGMNLEAICNSEIKSSTHHNDTATLIHTKNTKLF